MKTTTRVTVNKPAAGVKYPEVLNELEFSQPADVLLEAIRQFFLRRDGVNLSREERLEIAKQVLESRI